MFTLVPQIVMIGAQKIDSSQNHTNHNIFKKENTNTAYDILLNT